MTLMLLKDMWYQLDPEQGNFSVGVEVCGDQLSRGLLSHVTSWARHPPGFVGPPATLLWKSSSLRPSCLLRPSPAKELLMAPMFPGLKAGTPMGPTL